MPTEVNRGFDAHTHLIPPGLVDDARSGAFDLDLSDNYLVTPAARIPLDRIGKPELLAGWIQEQGLDGAIAFPPPPLFGLRHQEPEKWARHLNAAMVATCTGAIKPAAYLPISSPEATTRVLDDVGADFVGVVIGTDFGPHLPSAPVYNEIWQRLEERDLPIFLHPEASADSRLSSLYLANLLGNPIETTVVAAHLVLGGVLSRHQKLRIALSHGGGAVAQLIGRWDRGHSTGRPGLSALDQKPSEIVRRVFVDSVVHDANSLALLRAIFGDQQILFGSDWPFPMGTDSLASSFTAWPEGPSITANNSARFFGATN